MREVTVVVLYVSVCVSAFSILPSRAFRRQTRGISDYSVENAAKKQFSLKQLSLKFRSVINLPQVSQPFSSCAMFRVPLGNSYVTRHQCIGAGVCSVYLSVKHA